MSSTEASGVKDVPEDKQLTRRLSEEVSLRLNKAHTAANDLEQVVDNKVADTLDKLEQHEMEDLMSIDFESLPNHFQTLENSLLTFQFPMPQTWTKRYAASLLPDNNQSLPQSLTGSLISEHLQDSNPETDESRFINLDGATTRCPTRFTKSLGDLPGIQELDLQGKGDKKLLVSDSPIQTGRLHQEDGEQAKDAASSQRKVLDRSVEASEELAEFIDVVTFKRPNSSVQQNFLDGLDKISEDVELVTRTQTLPQVANSIQSTSKRHCSVGTQTWHKPNSAFEAYVELQRNLSTKSKETQKKLYKQMKQYRFLKDIRIEEFTKYRQDHARSTGWDKYSTYQQEMKDSDSDSQLKALKLKLKNMSLNTHMFGRKAKRDAQTLAVSPSHSFSDLEKMPSHEFTNIEKYLERQRKTLPVKSPIVIKYPTVLVSLKKSCSEVNTQWFKTLHELERSRSAKLKECRDNQNFLYEWSSEDSCGINEREEVSLHDVLRRAQSALHIHKYPHNDLSSSLFGYRSASALHVKSSYRRGFVYQHAPVPSVLKPVILPRTNLPIALARDLTQLAPNGTDASDDLATSDQGKDSYPSSVNSYVAVTAMGTTVRLKPQAQSSRVVAMAAEPMNS